MPRIPRAMRQVLLVGFVLACGASIVLPWFANVRIAAARTKCSYQAMQLGLAVHNYAAANLDRMPPGTISEHPLQPSSLPPERRLSWAVALVPYLGNPLETRFDLASAHDDEKNRSAMTQWLQYVVCPSSSERTGWGNASPTPVTHFIGVAGIGENAPNLKATDRGAGIFGHDDRWKLVAIPDGSANTFLVLETSRNPGHWAKGGASTVRGIDPADTPFVGMDRPGGGFHPGEIRLLDPRKPSANTVTCVGSGRSISNRISPEVLAALATADGRETVPTDW
jgi:hypothetical protein